MNPLIFNSPLSEALSLRAGGLGMGPHGGDSSRLFGLKVIPMSRQFSLATLFRMVPNPLLADFFARLDNPCYGLDWSRRPRRHVDSVLQCMEFFPPKKREAAELILRNVFDLACRSGIAAIRDAAQQLRRLELLPDSLSPYALSMWTWLHLRSVFELAVTLHEVDGLSWWRKRNDLPCVEPRTDDEALGVLADDVSRLLSREQGRGRHCTVEHLSRENGTNYFLCFPDDFPQRVTIHNREGELVTKRLRPTFEIAFAYRRDQGTLEMSAQLPLRLKRELESSFAWVILDEHLGPQIPEKVYELNELKRYPSGLDTDPVDQVHVQLPKIQLALRTGSRRITLESPRGPADEVWRMLEECLNEERVCLDEVDVTRATFRFHFAATTGRSKGTMTFDVAAPDRCTLRSHRPERVAVAHKYLRRWRILND